MTFSQNEIIDDNFCLDRSSCSTQNIRTEPKFIVFLSQLLILFKFCPICKADSPLTEVRKVGTMAEIFLHCSNPRCQKKSNVWRSQPYWKETKIPAGNLLLSFAVLASGGSASKILLMFKHMGMACISLRTFFKHQSVSIFLFKGIRISLLLEILLF